MSVARRDPSTVLFVLAMGLVLATLLSSLSGALTIPWAQLATLLFRPDTVDELTRQVFLNIRLPRVLFSGLNGAALAVAGVTMQALFRNPLAEPGLIGVSAGAALGAVLAIVLTSAGFLTVSTFAFIGGLTATWIAYRLGRRFHGLAGLLLAGIAINTIAGSAIGLMIYTANDNQLRDLTFWTMGSLAAGNWKLVLWLSPSTLLLLVYLCRQWRVMNALLLGEREAAHLGFELAGVRRRLILATVLIIGPLVAATGGIGFIGLIVPHLMRMLLGAHHKYLLPASMLAGALVLTLADCAARLVVSPAELPIGLVTSLVGGPFFFWMLIRTKTLS